MLKFEWNALRMDDRVLVHDPGRADMALTAGVVVMLETHRNVNGLGIAITATGGARKVLWPSHLAVHHDPRDLAEPCWRCQEFADVADRRPERQSTRAPTAPSLATSS